MVHVGTLHVPQLCDRVDEGNQLFALKRRLHPQLVQSDVLKLLTLVLDLQVSLGLSHVTQDGWEDLWNQVTFNCGLQCVCVCVCTY